jgi:hypothetical protein
MTRALLVFSLFLIISNKCPAQQKRLMLQKKNQNKNAYYKPGDEISFTLTGNKRKISGVIRDLKDSVIVFDGFEIRVNEIASLYIDEKTKWWLRYKVEQLGLIIGFGYLAIDIVNTGQINKETLIISGTLISIGILGKLLIGNQIKIRGRTKLHILKF